MTTTTTAIATLRLTGAAADTPALRLRAARELAGAELAPPGLPPAAVLVVRRLVDPLPRRLVGSAPRVRPDPAWERAVRERLADAARSAARTDARGALPADAAAVLFADPAEALACAVRERVRGGLERCWWWRSVRRRLAISPATGGRDPAPLLAARPREVPSAVAYLDRWREVPAVAAALSPAGATRVLVALADEHGLARGLVAPAGVPPGRSRSGDGTETQAGAAGPEAGAAEGRNATSDRRAPGAPPSEPWRPWLPAALDPWSPAAEVRCLLGVALGLAAAPHRLRSAEAVRGARRWWRWVSEGPPVPEPAGPARSAAPPGTRHRDPNEDRAEAAVADRQREKGREGARGDGPAAAATPGLEDGRRRAPEAGGPADPPRADATAGRRDHRSLPTVGETGAPSAPVGGTKTPPAGLDPRAAGQEIEGDLRRHGPPSSEEEPPSEAGRPARHSAAERKAGPLEERDRALPGRAVETRYGGVLFLIHALVALDLPDAFERGWRLASDAGPWGTLDLVARGLLGERFAGAADDPLWRALAELAAWPAEPPLRRSRPAYRVPAAWPSKLGDSLEATSWSAARGRLRVWAGPGSQGGGYLVADVTRSTDPPSVQARRELARVFGRAARPKSSHPLRRPAASAPLADPPPLPPGCPPRLGAWLAAALPAIRRRLLLALVGGGSALGRALAAPGRLHVTSSHVDLVLPMSAADLAVRRAGLDRDPGWLPALGRVVYFHFE